MLVDLARNDLGRVSAPGSVRVVEFGAVERYSHVWHIVSTVESTVAAGQGRLRRAHRDLPGRHADRRAEGAGDGAHRRVRTGPARGVRRSGRLPRRGRRPRRRDRDPHRGDAARRRRLDRLRAGGGRRSSPTASPSSRNSRPATRPAPCCRPSPPPRRSKPVRRTRRDETVRRRPWLAQTVGAAALLLIATRDWQTVTTVRPRPFGDDVLQVCPAARWTGRSPRSRSSRWPASSR